MDPFAQEMELPSDLHHAPLFNSSVVSRCDDALPFRALRVARLELDGAPGEDQRALQAAESHGDLRGAPGQLATGGAGRALELSRGWRSPWWSTLRPRKELNRGVLEAIYSLFHLVCHVEERISPLSPSLDLFYDRL